MNRLKYYTKAKELLIQKKKRYTCTALREALLEDDINIKVEDIEQHFPELKKRLPLKTDRIKLLDECINEIKKEKPLFECFVDDDWDFEETKNCAICGNKLTNPTNPIGNTHYDCWLNLPYF